MLYVKTTLDKYEFPIAVADSAAELAKMLGKSPNTVHSSFSKKIKGWYRIPEEDLPDNE